MGIWQGLVRIYTMLEIKIHYNINPGLLIKNYFSYFSTNTYVVGSQKNHLDEMVLLSTQTYVRTNGQDNFILKKYVSLNLCITQDVFKI